MIKMSLRYQKTSIQNKTLKPYKFSNTKYLFISKLIYIKYSANMKTVNIYFD